MQKDLISVAKIGRCFGVKGEVFLQILSDFPESIKAGNTYSTQIGDLTIESFSPKRAIAKFTQINSKEETKQIVNLLLYTTKDESLKQCALKEGEFLWFELIGANIIENGEILGEVAEIERFCEQDYLHIKTHKDLSKNLPKSFLIPYAERYILSVEGKDSSKIINTRYCKEILENS